MKLKTFIIAFTLVFGVLLAFGASSWALASPPERETPRATAAVDSGEAWVQKSGALEWVALGGETAVAIGDRIKTGEKSRARVEFFDGSVARLDQNSEIIIEELAVDPENTALQRVSIQVLGGRVWSRILKFLDQGSAYSAKMSDVVATVRGTAFVMDATNPEALAVQIIENAVAVSSAGAAEETFAAGEEALLTRVAAATTTVRQLGRRRLSERVLAEPWFREMKNSDQGFLEKIRVKRFKEFQKQAGALPGSPFYGLKLVGEKLRGSLVSAPERRRDLALRFADRRFAEIVALAGTGRKKTAERLLIGFERKYLPLLKEVRGGELPAEKREQLCRQLRGRFLEQELRLRDLGNEELKSLLTAVPAGAPDLQTPPWEQRNQLCPNGEKLPELRRLLPEALSPSQPAPENVNEPVLSVPSAPLLVNTNLNLNSPTASPPPPTNLNANVAPAPAPSPLPKVTSLSVWGPRSILYLPDSEQLSAKATYSDGAVKDVTSLASWASSDAYILTAASGMVLTKNLGNATVSAFFEGVTGTFAIKVVTSPVTAPPTLESLSVVCSPSTVAPYGSSVCSATAHYSDGTTKNVTVQAVWSAVGAGSMDGNTFYAYQSPGSAQVAADYTDGTTSVKGSATVTVQ
ncbi:hypothetical protein EPN90_04075 [Patescibacteria group bacterium]|nr:MAG: hypothetical protein EPN90_04075 [Patescibacteria group bacterium]